MTLFVNEVELIWAGSNALVAVLGVATLVDALRDAQAVHRANGRARILTTRGNVVRAALLLLASAFLLGAVIPGLFTDNPANVTPTVILLMAVPWTLAAMGFHDAYIRDRLNALSDEQIEAERSVVLTKLDALETQVDAVGAAATVASNRAEAAVTEASRLRPTIEETRELTGEVHDAVIPPKDAP